MWKAGIRASDNDIRLAAAFYDSGDPADKPRFEHAHNPGRIRVIQGHDKGMAAHLDPNLLWKRVDQRDVRISAFVHGTELKNLNSIISAGLLSKKKRFIHGRQGTTEFYRASAKPGATLEVWLDIGKMIKDGMEIFLTPADHVLCEGFVGNSGVIPAAYFKKIEDRQGRNLFPRVAEPDAATLRAFRQEIANLGLYGREELDEGAMDPENSDVLTTEEDASDRVLYSEDTVGRPLVLTL